MHSFFIANTFNIAIRAGWLIALAKAASDCSFIKNSSFL
jgi:hypothetical protein